MQAWPQEFVGLIESQGTTSLKERFKRGASNVKVKCTSIHIVDRGHIHILALRNKKGASILPRMQRLKEPGCWVREMHGFRTLISVHVDLLS